jgi:hypothetical protein
MRHQKNCAGFFLQGLLQTFHAFGRIVNIVKFLQHESIEEHIGKIMKLTPGAPYMGKPVFLWKNRPVKPNAGIYPPGKEHKKTRGNDPGEHNKNPGSH